MERQVTALTGQGAHTTYVDSETGKPVGHPIYSMEEFATRERVSVATVRAWRFKGQDPVSFKVGKHVRYRLEDIEAWEREQIAKAVA